MRVARLLSVVCACLLATQNARADLAGQVLAASGEVLALRAGRIIALFPGAAIESGDQIHTGADGNLQLRFTDWGVVSLRPRTDFVVEDYVYEARAGGRERAFFSLLNGGIRSLTGLIGRRDRGHYRLRTTLSTIGIRGTDYSVLICRQDCRDADGRLGEDGLYGSVLDGRIAVSPYGGAALEREFGAGEQFHLANESSVPVPLFSLPGFFPDKMGPQARPAGGGDTLISSPGKPVPGARPAPVASLTGDLPGVLSAIVPAQVGAIATIEPLPVQIVLPAASLAGLGVNSALSLPALSPVVPLAGAAFNAVPAVVKPVLSTLPVTVPVVPPVSPQPLPIPIISPAPAPTPIATPTPIPIASPTPIPSPVTNPVTLPVTNPITTPVTTPTLPTVPSLPLGAIAPKTR